MRSRTEIKTAIERMEPGALLRLKKFAQYQILRMGSDAGGRTFEDLLSEAITDTLTGRRGWSNGVDFETHLADAMRGIVGCWKEAPRQDTVPDFETKNRAAEGPNTIANANTTLHSERILAAKEEMQRIRRALRKDPAASHVLDLIAFDFTPREIQQRLDITQQDYAAATRRIRRRLEALYPECKARRRSARHKRLARQSTTPVAAFICPYCGGKIEKVTMGSANRVPIAYQWKCVECSAPFGPPWATGDLSTALLGVQPWPASGVNVKRVEWPENRDGSLFFVIAERYPDGWRFFEKNTWENRWFPMNATPALIVQAERLAAGDKPPLGESPNRSEQFRS
jgi:hypothetical protein